MFHVKHFPSFVGASRGNVSRESLANAELGEDHIQNFFHIHITCDASEILRGSAHVLGAQLQWKVVSVGGDFDFAYG